MAESKWFPDPTEPVAHMQRKPGETFEQLEKRTGIPVPIAEQVTRYIGAEKRADAAKGDE